MTNTGPQNFPSVTSMDSLEEKSTHEEVSFPNSELNNSSTAHDAKCEKSNEKEKNLIKQMCRFFMNYNYCRYGRNCRFSHAKPDTPELLNSINSRYEANKGSNSKTSSKARNIKQNTNSKESFHCRDESEVKMQHQAEKGGDSTMGQCFEASSQVDKYSNQSGGNSARQCGGTSKYVGDRDPDESSVRMAQRSSGSVRQRNLYFYRSKTRNMPSDSPSTRTKSSKHCRYFVKGFCRQGDSCKFLHQIDDKCDTVEESRPKSIGESVVSETEKSATEAHNELQLRNCSSIPVIRRFIKLQDVDQKNIQALRDTEIQQLKKRFPAHELIKSSPEEIFRVTFSPSDPDWSFAVNSVSLEISFGKEYPHEACTIKVLEDDSLPPILVRHLNKSISEWIKEKYQSAVAMGIVELLFRPFLMWFDRNLGALFLIGLRKVKQDVLAKESGIEFVPYEELPGSVAKAPSVTCVMGTEADNKQDDCLSTPQKSVDIDFIEDEEKSFESKNINHMQHTDDDGDTIQERAVAITPELQMEKENFSPDFSSFSSNKGSEYPISANTSVDKFSVPKLGTEVKLLGLELKEGAAAMDCIKIAVTLQCCRCKARHEINTPPKRNNSLNCIKCHHSMQIVFQSAMLHQFSAVMGYLHLVECQAVDIPLMDCNFIVDCLNCSKQISVNGIHYGQQRVTWCLYCNKKLSIYTQSVKFHQLQPASNIVSSGHNLIPATKKEKRIVKDPAIQEGKPLPDCGTCKHYKKSYRWLRFPCCGKAYPCDVCHEEKETDHEMKFASRMICGFCAKEQPYAGNRPCISCSSNMTKKAGAHWEGGKGCRDKITMCREDRQKYAGMSKTISRKAQIQNPSKK